MNNAAHFATRTWKSGTVVTLTTCNGGATEAALSHDFDPFTERWMQLVGWMQPLDFWRVTSMTEVGSL